jgi:capsular exopolysaccharide synthesis family protein
MPSAHSVDPIPSEIYRILFSSMERRILGKSIKSIAVTSATQGEGKTTTVVQLAKTAVQDFGRRVLLLEADLRNPRFQAYWTKPDGIGLYHILSQRISPSVAIGPSDIDGLDILPAGETVKKQNFSGSMLANGLRKVLEDAESQYDFILVDCPPILPLVDMRIIAPQVNGVLMVVRAGGPPRSVVRHAAQTLQREKVLGLVFNSVDMVWPQYGYGYPY